MKNIEPQSQPYRGRIKTIFLFFIIFSLIISQNLYSQSGWYNYPNPFNPTTKIRFEIPLSRGVSEGRGVLVKLIIYNILGREVATLVNEELKPGSYEYEWDASGFASGVYFYKITTQEFSQTRRMVLIK